MSFPSSPPISHDPRPWSFPRVHQVSMPWGLRLAVVRVATLPLVQVRWTFRGGRSVVASPVTGAARLMANVARHGTRAHDSAALAQALDQIGARLRTGVSLDQAHLSVTGQSAHLDRLLDLADEVAFSPTFPEGELERERAQALELHEHERTHAETVAARWLAWLLHDGHPYGWPPTTSPGLTGATRDQLVALQAQLMAPQRGLLTVVGDVEPEATLAALSARYATAPFLGEAIPALRPAPRSAGRRVVAVERPGSEQVAVAMGHTALPRSSADYLPLRVANQAFGGGASGRLFLELREKRSLTYGAYSALDAGVLGGDLITSLSTAPERAAEAVRALDEQWTRLRAEPLPDDELEPARRYLAGSFPQSASGVAGIGGLVALAWIAGLPEETWAAYPGAVAAVDAAAAQQAVERWVRPSETFAVVVGPREAAFEAAATLGEPEVGSASEPVWEPRESAI